MPTFELSISDTYVSNWGFVEAIRELFQNALDQSTVNPSNEMFFDYTSTDDTAPGVLRIGNKESVLSRSSLLLGESTKRDDDATIGKFGEGYKLGLLVLARLGYDVRIYNYGCKELWTPSIAHSAKYDARVLRIDVKKFIFRSVPDHNLVFEIANVPLEDYERLKEFNLNIRDDVDSIDTSIGRILKNEEFKGKVFVKGLFVSECDEDGMAYGYDLQPHMIKLDRDRRSVDSFNVFWTTSQVWKHTGLLDEIIRLLKNGTPDVKYLHYHGQSDKIADRAHEEFRAEYGAKAVPVTNQRELSKVKKGKPVIVSESYSSLIKSSPSYSAPAPAKRDVERRSKSPKTHLEAFMRRYKKQLPASAQSSFNQILGMSDDWTWKS